MRITRTRRAALAGALTLGLTIGIAVTPFAAVAAANADEAPTVAVNEVQSNDSAGGPDWIEVHNYGATAVDLSGWVVLDSGVKDPYTVPAGTLIQPSGFLVVEPKFGLGKEDSARLFLPDGTTLIDSYSWTAHATTNGRCADGTGAWRTGLTPTPGAANACTEPGGPTGPVDPSTIPAILVNEVESSGGVPGDWIELFNSGETPVDVSGWIIRDDDDSHALAIGAGSTIPAGGFLAVDTEPAFGLGGADSARLFLADGTTLVDSYSWTAHAAVTYGRCPDGGADWRDTTTATKGAANDCSEPVDPLETEPWPGPAGGMTAVDTANAFGADMSSVVYEDADTIWAVNNGNATLHQLQLTGGALSEQQRWTLRYPDGGGAPDAEGVALIGGSAAKGVLVGSERNGSDKNVSRPSVLRYAVSGSGDLTATREWNLQSRYPGIGANSGIEGIAWIADEELVAAGLVDLSTGDAYDPDLHPAHSGGVVFVGIEASSTVTGYLLGDAGEIVRIAEFETAFPGVMELEYDASSDRLWVLCDEVCEGRSQVFEVGSAGAFAAVAAYERPSGTQNYANEGFAIAPASQCAEGQRQVIWADDNQTGGHAFRVGSIDCESGSTGGGSDGGEGDGGGTGGGSENGSGGSTPAPPAESALTPQLRDGISAPASVEQQGSFSVYVGDAHAGEIVDVWIFSTPTHLGRRTVNAQGYVTVSLPQSVAAGSHRIVVTDASGAVIGWRWITVSGGAKRLSTTGTTVDSPLALAGLAGILLLTGAGSLLARRREA